MGNLLKKWMHRGEENRDKDIKEIDLGDVTPEHPEDYPARNLKERLDQRRDTLDDIEGGPKGMPEGLGGY